MMRAWQRMDIGELALLFVGGALLANGVPHFTHGISGKSFPTPFATPPGKGESPPVANVLWGFANLMLGALAVGGWPEEGAGCAAVGAGALLTALGLAWWFGSHRLARLDQKPLRR